MEARRERGREREMTDLYSPQQIEQFEQQLASKQHLASEREFEFCAEGRMGELRT